MSVSVATTAPSSALAEGSEAQKINAEVVTLLGWGPAILMQFAHPLVAAGVADHSIFAASPEQRWRRLHQTVEAMLALTFGTEAEAARAAAGINAIHDRVHGTLPEAVGVFPAGTAYSAHDPALLRWVHATMLHMQPRSYELFVGPLTAAKKDRYCLEASAVAPLLGIPDGYLPTTTAELDRYLDTTLASGQIAVGHQARRLAHEILHPIFPRPARPFLLPLVQLPTIGLLPPAIRAMYGFPWDARHQRALWLIARLTRAGLRATPPPIRHFPAARRAQATR